MLPRFGFAPAKLKYFPEADDLNEGSSSPSTVGVHLPLTPLSLSPVSSGLLMRRLASTGDLIPKRFVWAENGLSSVLSSPSLTRVVQPGVHPPICLMKPLPWEEWAGSYLIVC